MFIVFILSSVSMSSDDNSSVASLSIDSSVYLTNTNLIFELLKFFKSFSKTKIQQINFKMYIPLIVSKDTIFWENYILSELREYNTLCNRLCMIFSDRQTIQSIDSLSKIEITQQKNDDLMYSLKINFIYK